MRIAIVDDESHAIEVLTDHLEALEMETSFTETSSVNFLTSTASWTEESAPEVIFMDIDMPGINGIELAQAILASFPNIKIVFVTAHPDYALQVFDIGCEFYMLKPITFTHFSRVINRLLSKSSFRQEKPKQQFSYLPRPASRD